MWCFSVSHQENVLEHMSHLNRLSPTFVNVWRFRFSTHAKSFPQMSHLNFFSPVCVKMSRFKYVLNKNAFPYIIPEMFLPQVRNHILIQIFTQNDFPHTSQLFGFSPVCIKLWCLRFQQLPTAHIWKVFPQCVYACKASHLHLVKMIYRIHHR